MHALPPATRGQRFHAHKPARWSPHPKPSPRGSSTPTPQNPETPIHPEHVLLRLALALLQPRRQLGVGRLCGQLGLTPLQLAAQRGRLRLGGRCLAGQVSLELAQQALERRGALPGRGLHRTVRFD